MQYGQLLSRAWNIIWEHKFLILLGVLVALGSSSGGGGSSGANAVFNQRSGEAPQMPEMPQIPEIRTVAPIIAIVVILAIIVAVVIALAFWVVSTIARGGLIAGVSSVDEGAPTNFAEAWTTGWHKGWRLLGIGLIPAIPIFLLVVIGLVLGLAAGGFALFTDLTAAPVAGLGVIAAGLACILVPIALILGLLQTFANRALVLEDLGVFGSYQRGGEVLLDNFGPAVVLFLIQIGISIAIGIVGFLPGILFRLCCVLWPLLLLVQGAIAAYFSTMWTLAWRAWTGLTSFEAEEAALDTTVE